MHFDNIFKKSLYTKRFYFRMLIPFLVLTVLIVVSAALIFSSLYMNTLYEQLVIESMYSMERLTNDVDNIFSQLEDTKLRLNDTAEIDSYLHDSIFDGLLLVRADKYLVYIANTNNYLNSVILYNKNADFPIVAGKANIDSKQFFSNKLKRPDLNSTLNLFYCSLNPINPTSTLDQRSLETTSLISSDSWNNDGTFDNGIIFVLNKYEIQKKLLSEFDGISLIVDKSGKVAFCSDGYLSNSSIIKDSYFSQILHSGKIKGNFRTIIDNDNKIISYSKSLKSDFYIINIKSYDYITKPMKDKRNFILIISLLVAFVLGTLAYFVSRFVYSPIRKITEMFKHTKYLKSDSGLDEVSIISKVFKETQEYIEILETKTHDNNIKLKEDYLRQLLKDNKIAESDKNSFNAYQFKITFDNLIFTSIRVDNYNTMSKNDKNAYVTTLCKIIPELLKENFESEIVDMFHGEMALLLNYVNTRENDFDMLVHAMDNLRDTTRKTLGITLSIGIGGVSSSFEECAYAYKKAVDMVKHRFVLGTDRTLYPTYIEETLTTKISYPTEMEDKLITSIKSNKKLSFVKNLDDTFELLKNYPYSEAISVFFQITTSCIKTINQTTTQDSSKFSLNFDELSSIFSSLQTLDQAKNWLLNIFNEYQLMLESIQQMKGNKHYNLVDKVQKYIIQNYQDMNLSVESLADSVGYSPYYLSKICKEITGVNISDYIRQIRIDKAKEFLGTDDYKINEIPCMVGFTNISHFYSVFKKAVGLTPAAYKEYIQDSNNPDRE